MSKRYDVVLTYNPIADAFVGRCPACKGRIELNPNTITFHVDECQGIVEFYGEGTEDDPYGVGIVCLNQPRTEASEQPFNLLAID